MLCGHGRHAWRAVPLAGDGQSRCSTWFEGQLQLRVIVLNSVRSSRSAGVRWLGGEAGTTHILWKTEFSLLIIRLPQSECR